MRASEAVLTGGMPLDRMVAFQRSVADRLRSAAAQGIGEQPVIAQVVAEQVALAKAVADPSFITAMTMAYQLEMRNQNPNPAYAVSSDEAQRAVMSILRNRIADIQQFVRMLGDDGFIAATRAEAAQPAPAAKPYQLPERKINEVVRRLVQPMDVAGAEPAIHVASSAIGHEITHRALANTFRPMGPLRAHLVHALATAWPQASGEALEQLAGSWLKARHDPAHAVADGQKIGGVIYTPAMQQADVLQKQKLTTLSQTLASPANSVSGEKQWHGTVRNTKELALDAI